MDTEAEEILLLASSAPSNRVLLRPNKEDPGPSEDKKVARGLAPELGLADGNL